MYDRKTWGGAVDPFILVKFIKNTAEDNSDPIASVIVFEWKDYDLIGVLPTADSIQVPLRTKSCERARSDAYYRGNISATRRQSKINGVIPIRLGNLSWRRMRQSSLRTRSSPRRYI
jgi:hypothetical protein